MTREIRQRLYVGGEWVEPAGGHYEVVNPADESVVGLAPEASKEQVYEAAAAAREAFGPWSRTRPEERAAILDRAARQLPPPRVLLVGMEALTNYGADYTARFRSVFRAVAEKNGARFLPFLLEGVAGVPALNLPDGLHPNAEGQKRVAGNVWKVLRPML